MEHQPVIFITGVSSGLGKATCEMALTKGWKVLGVDLREPENINSDNFHFVQIDITDFDSLRQCFEGQENIRAIVHCAGIAPAAKLFSKRNGLHSRELFSTVMKVNALGSFNVLTTGAEALIQNKIDDGGQRGVVILTSSIAADEGQVGQVSYAASKGAVSSMILPAARELAAWGIRVMGIAPGVFNTQMVASFSEKVKAELTSHIPCPPRLGSPQEYAKLAFHIVENNYLNGSTIRLDGGLRMN